MELHNLGTAVARCRAVVLLRVELALWWRRGQSVSHYHTPTTEHMAHTHTLVFSFFERGGISASFCLLAGFALQDDVLFLPFAFTYLLVGADLDENGPR